MVSEGRGPRSATRSGESGRGDSKAMLHKRMPHGAANCSPTLAAVSSLAWTSPEESRSLTPANSSPGLSEGKSRLSATTFLRGAARDLNYDLL